jgi:hypothetical protein
MSKKTITFRVVREGSIPTRTPKLQGVRTNINKKADMVKCRLNYFLTFLKNGNFLILKLQQSQLY